MKKLLFTILFTLVLSGCAPDPVNFVGMDNSWIKPLAILFVICAIIVIIFVISVNQLHKKKYSLGFFEGVAFLAGPGIITFICYILMALSGFLLISFWSNIIVSIAVLMGVIAFIVSYIEGKKK